MIGYICAKNSEYHQLRAINLAYKEGAYFVLFYNEKNEEIHAFKINNKNYTYLKTISGFLRAIDYIIKKIKLDVEILKYDIDNIWFYNYNLELSRRHILSDIKDEIDSADYWNLANEWLKTFNKEHNIEVFLLGKGSRHCCIKDTAKNRYNYAELRKAFNEMQDEFIKALNGE